MADIVNQTLFVVVLFTMIAAFMSATDINVFIKRLKKPKGILIGLICQYILLPLLGFSLATIFNFDYESSIALILTSTCPGGILSNFFCFLIGADLPLSVAMTTASTCLAFVFIPLNTFIYVTIALDSIHDNSDRQVEIDWIGISTTTLALIIGGLFGAYISWKDIKIAKRILAPLTTLFLIVVIVIALYDNLTSEYPLYKLDWNVYIATLLLTVCGWIFGVLFAQLLCKMKKSSSVAIGVETSNQNSALAITILTLTVTNNDTLLNKVISIPGIYLFLTWGVNAVFLYMFYKLGWVEQEKDDQSSSCCILIAKYKEYVKAMKDDNGEGNEDEKVPPTTISGNISVASATAESNGERAEMVTP